MYLNRATIVGNLTRDPELKSLPSGMQVASFSVATNRVWKDKQGQRQEEADYHNIVVFGKQAETSSQYLKKGQQVLLEGRIQTRSWDGTDGKKQYRTEIVADFVQFGSRKDGDNKSNLSPEEIKKIQDKRDGEKRKELTESEIEYPSEEITPDDIPF
jgi:single-strand DNA-binding protein